MFILVILACAALAFLGVYGAGKYRRRRHEDAYRDRRNAKIKADWNAMLRRQRDDAES